MDLSDFEPNRDHELTDDVPGVDAALLADLYDCVAKFGGQHPSPQMRMLKRFGERNIIVSVVIDPPGNHNMLVTRSAYGFGVGQMWTILLSDALPSGVAWQKGITAEDVRALIAETDARMREQGHFDPATGERLRLEGPSPQLLRVAEVFYGPHIVIMVPEDVSPNTVLSWFDKPQELRLIVTQEGAYGYVHEKDRSMTAIVDATDETLAAWGLSGPDDLNGLSDADRRRFVADAQRRFATKNN